MIYTPQALSLDFLGHVILMESSNRVDLSSAYEYLINNNSRNISSGYRETCYEKNQCLAVIYDSMDKVLPYIITMSSSLDVKFHVASYDIVTGHNSTVGIYQGSYIKIDHDMSDMYYFAWGDKQFLYVYRLIDFADRDEALENSTRYLQNIELGGYDYYEQRPDGSYVDNPYDNSDGAPRRYLPLDKNVFTMWKYEL